MIEHEESDNLSQFFKLLKEAKTAADLDKVEAVMSTLHVGEKRVADDAFSARYRAMKDAGAFETDPDPF